MTARMPFLIPCNENVKINDFLAFYDNQNLLPEVSTQFFCRVNPEICFFFKLYTSSKLLCKSLGRYNVPCTFNKNIHFVKHLENLDT